MFPLIAGCCSPASCSLLPPAAHLCLQRCFCLLFFLSVTFCLFFCLFCFSNTFIKANDSAKDKRKKKKNWRTACDLILSRVNISIIIIIIIYFIPKGFSRLTLTGLSFGSECLVKCQVRQTQAKHPHDKTNTSVRRSVSAAGLPRHSCLATVDACSFASTEQIHSRSGVSRSELHPSATSTSPNNKSWQRLSFPELQLNSAAASRQDGISSVCRQATSAPRILTCRYGSSPQIPISQTGRVGEKKKKTRRSL